MRLIILRPQPRAGQTTARAKALGLEVLEAPLFDLVPVAWELPDIAGLDAVMLTSANAVETGGLGLQRFRHMPCYAVGEATAQAAHAVGFQDVRRGDWGAAELAAKMAADDVECALHLCGKHHTPFASWPVRIVRRIVYDAKERNSLPDPEIITRGLVLLHSRRAARHFAKLVDQGGLAREQIRLAALSPAIAAAAGEGWRDKQSAHAPRDEALLELAAKLCQTG